MKRVYLTIPELQLAAYALRELEHKRIEQAMDASSRKRMDTAKADLADGHRCQMLAQKLYEASK